MIGGTCRKQGIHILICLQIDDGHVLDAGKATTKLAEVRVTS